MEKLMEYFENISPAELARLRDKNQRLSTRDKALLLKKVAEIENIVNKMGKNIFIE